MRDPAEHTFYDLEETLRAIAEPTRRRILQRLLEGEAGLPELSKLFPIHENSLTKHMRLLERAHLVGVRRVNRKQLWSVRIPPLLEATAWMQAQCELWETVVDGRGGARRRKGRAVRKPRRKSGKRRR